MNSSKEAMLLDIDPLFMVKVRLGITYFCLFMYGYMFVYIYTQLCLVFRYDYKKWCYRTYILFVSITWCILRITLFSYYCLMEHRVLQGFHIESDDVGVISRRVGPFVYFLLFSFPLYLQFSCLCLITAYFHQIHRSSQSNYHPSELGVWRWPSVVLCIMNVSLFILNLSVAVFIKMQDNGLGVGDSVLQSSTDMLLESNKHTPHSLPIVTLYLVHLRVLLNGGMFVAVTCGLAYLTTKVARTSEARLLLETENMTHHSAVATCVLLVFLFSCRTAINILALIPAVSFVVDTDQIDLLSDSHTAYFMLVSVLILWEYVPIMLMVYFFRVKSPSLLTTTITNSGDPTSTIDYTYHNSFSSNLLTDSFSDASTDGEQLTRYSFHNAGGPIVPIHGITSASDQYFQHHHHHHHHHGTPYYNPAIMHQFPQVRYNISSTPEVAYAPLADIEDEHTAPVHPATVSEPEAGIHSQSSRFTHRTSLFGYSVLNRSNRRVMM